MPQTAKDLTKEAPRSPRPRIGGYAILGRTIDKGRADINGTLGEYHFDCPLDNMLFGFKEVKGAEFRKLLASGASDEDVATWLDTHGAPKSPAQVKTWADSIEAMHPYENPERREWFKGECERVGLDPKSSTLFDYLEADDKASFKK